MEIYDLQKIKKNIDRAKAEIIKVKFDAIYMLL